MKWFLRDKLIEEIKGYIQEEVYEDSEGGILFTYRFDQGLKEILERYYDTGRED